MSVEKTFHTMKAGFEIAGGDATGRFADDALGLIGGGSRGLEGAVKRWVADGKVTSPLIA